MYGSVEFVYEGWCFKSNCEIQKSGSVFMEQSPKFKVRILSAYIHHYLYILMF
jgi:hypothetical protein